MIVVDFSEDDGEILFKSESSWDDTITEIGSVIRHQSSDLEIEEKFPTLSVSVPAFLENFDSIIEILSYIEPDKLDINNCAAILEWARDVLDTMIFIVMKLKI